MPILPPPRCFLIRSFTAYASLEMMQSDIGHALAGRHVIVTEHLHSTFANFELFKHQFAQISKHDGRRFVLDTNLNHNYRTDGRSLYDFWKLPRFSFLTDSPVHKLDLLDTFPERGLMGLVDLDFPEILAHFAHPGRGAIPFPHAGPPPLPDPPPTRDRDIDVLIVGNISSPLTPSQWLDAEAAGDPARRSALDAMLARARGTDASLWSIASEEAEAKGLDTAPSAVAALVRTLEGQLIAGRRRDILQSIRGRRSVVFHGDIPQGCSLTPSEAVQIRDLLPFHDVLDLMQRSKIVLNISPSFRNGAHERVFYALSRGALVLTEPSRFLTAEVDADLGIGFLPFDAEKTDDAIDAMLDRGPDALDSLRERAMAHYAASHVWDCRVASLLDAMQERFWAAESA